MKKRIKHIVSHPLFSGSLIMIIGSNATNALNYIYHLAMGRLLGPVGYGELASLISLLLLLGMIPSSVGLVVIKFVSAAKNREDIENLVGWLRKKVLVGSIVMIILALLSSLTISKFLNLEHPLYVFLIGILLFFALPTYLNRAALQGLMDFRAVVVSILAENSVKLILGAFLVYLGFSVGGAMLALILSAFLAWLLSYKFIKQHTTFKDGSGVEVNSLLRYSLPVVIQSISITSLYSMDLILVKHFFSSHEAGLYAALSTLGKIIYFGAGPISSVMFPIVSKKHSLGEEYKRIFLYSLLLVIFFSLAILTIYTFIPEMMIKILYGSSYLEASSLLVWFGIFMTMFTLATLFIHFYLSLGKTKIVVLPLISAIFQALMIVFYHDSLRTVIIVSIAVTTLLLLGLIIYFFYATKDRFSHHSSL